MEELVKDIKRVQTDLDIELQHYLDGNKSAGLRARKATLVLEGLYLKFRKESIAAGK